MNVKKSTLVGLTESSNLSANQISSNPRNFSQNFKQRQRLLNKYLLNQIVSTPDILPRDRLDARLTGNAVPVLNKMTPQQVFNRNSNY